MEPVHGTVKWHSGTGKWQDNWFTLNTADGAPSLVYAKAPNNPPLGSLSLSDLHKVTPTDGPEVPGWKKGSRHSFFKGKSIY
jgi:hypothetical protein